MLKLIIFLAAVAVCYGQWQNIRVKYTLFTRDDQSIGQDMTESTPEIFNTTQKTIFLIHGYAGNTVTRFNQLVRRDIFSNTSLYCNVIVVDWISEASFSYTHATNNVPNVARNLVSFIQRLTTKANFWKLKSDTRISYEATEEPSTTTTTTKPIVTAEPITSTTEPTTTPEPTTTTIAPETTTTTTEPTTTEPTTTEPTTTEPTTTPEPTTTIAPETTTTTTEPTTTEPTTTPEPTTTIAPEPNTTTTEPTTTAEPTTTTTTTPELTTTTEEEIATEGFELPSDEANVEDFHLVGFDLGAHVAGIAGRILREDSQYVGRITGLNPSGRQWGAGSERLRRGDARYVEVIHTDTLGVFANGIGDPIGDINFYANGGNNQPGCLTHSCCHDRSFELFAASMINKNLRGRACDTQVQMNLNLCRGDYLHLGGAALSKNGAFVYRINTSRRHPF